MGFSTSLLVNLTELKSTVRTKPANRGITKKAFPLHMVLREIFCWPRVSGSSRMAFGLDMARCSYNTHDEPLRKPK